MTLYIKKFQDHEDYVSYRNSNSFITPNVSSCVNQYEAHINGFDFVDLGLPSGTLWGKYNIGGTSNKLSFPDITPTPEPVKFSSNLLKSQQTITVPDTWGNTGWPFMFGGTEPNFEFSQQGPRLEYNEVVNSGLLSSGQEDGTFTWEDVPYAAYDENNGYYYTKYTSSADTSLIYQDKTIDNKLKLDSEDDAATQILGPDWLTPEAWQFMELMEYCEFSADFSYPAIKATSQINGKSIYFPYQYFYSPNSPQDTNQQEEYKLQSFTPSYIEGFYLSKNLCSNNNDSCLAFVYYYENGDNKPYCNIKENYRYIKMFIKPVKTGFTDMEDYYTDGGDGGGVEVEK